jgi:hypothetical protein
MRLLKEVIYETLLNTVEEITVRVNNAYRVNSIKFRRVGELKLLRLAGHKRTFI